MKVRALEEETLERIRKDPRVTHLSFQGDPVNSSLGVLEIDILEHEDALPSIIEMLVRSGVRVIDFNHSEVPLEDVFAQIVKRKDKTM